MENQVQNPPALIHASIERPNSKRRINLAHFAFLRAIVQGVPASQAWVRYLGYEADRVDERIVRKTVVWLRGELAAAAKRERRPSTARLIQLDMSAHVPTNLDLPSLDAFVAARGMEGFSEREILQEYQAQYGPQEVAQMRRFKRNERLIKQQLQAIDWLEGLVAQQPSAGDGVSAWFDPIVSDRLERSNLHTLAQLANFINAQGHRWWRFIDGLGQVKGTRIIGWLQDNTATTGLTFFPHIYQKFSTVPAEQLQRVVYRCTSVVPLEKFVVPRDFDGSAGVHRAPRSQCLLQANNDYDALLAWLASRRDVPATQRSYRREGERVLLWAILERGKALSSLDVEDARAYLDFLRSPPSSWCGPRHHQRWSPLWRPLEGALSAHSLRQALVVVRQLYEFLVRSGYVIGNPFAGVATPAMPTRSIGSGRALTRAQLEHLQTALRSQSIPSAELCLQAVSWLYATGMRRDEIVRATCADLERLQWFDQTGKGEGWFISVIGKGAKLRQVPVPTALVEQLQKRLAKHGRSADVCAPENAQVPILVHFDDLCNPQSWTASGLHQALKKAFEIAARTIGNEPDAAQLRAASAHWLRHSHASHALNSENPVSVQIIQNNLGHSSLATTSAYLTTEKGERYRAMEEFWEFSQCT